MMKTKTKKFDCVEMMHNGADSVRQETAGMNHKEKLIYWQKQDKLFEQKYQKLLREKNAEYNILKSMLK